MFLKINERDYEIKKISPLNFNLSTHEWQSIRIETKDKVSITDKLEKLVLKDYLKEGQDAEIVMKEIKINGNLICISKVSYCSIIR